MAKYINTIKTNKTEGELNLIISEQLSKARYKYIKFQDDWLWKKGGVFVAPQLIKVDVKGSDVTINAWLKFAWLPGIYSGEMGLTGAVGFVIKDVMSKVIAKLEAKIKE